MFSERAHCTPFSDELTSYWTLIKYEQHVNTSSMIRFNGIALHCPHREDEDVRRKKNPNSGEEKDL